MNKNQVTVKCYGTERVWSSNLEAINFYKECCKCSEGSEQRRYANILCQLLDGCKYCTDED